MTQGQSNVATHNCAKDLATCVVYTANIQNLGRLHLCKNRQWRYFVLLGPCFLSVHVHSVALMYCSLQYMHSYHWHAEPSSFSRCHAHLQDSRAVLGVRRLLQIPALHWFQKRRSAGVDCMQAPATESGLKEAEYHRKLPPCHRNEAADPQPLCRRLFRQHRSLNRW